MSSLVFEISLLASLELAGSLPNSFAAVKTHYLSGEKRIKLTNSECNFKDAIWKSLLNLDIINNTRRVQCHFHNNSFSLVLCMLSYLKFRNTHVILKSCPEHADIYIWSGRRALVWLVAKKEGSSGWIRLECLPDKGCRRFKGKWIDLFDWKTENRRSICFKMLLGMLVRWYFHLTVTPEMNRDNWILVHKHPAFHVHSDLFSFLAHFISSLSKILNLNQTWWTLPSDTNVQLKHQPKQPALVPVRLCSGDPKRERQEGPRPVWAALALSQRNPGQQFSLVSAQVQQLVAQCHSQTLN